MLSGAIWAFFGSILSNKFIYLFLLLIYYLFLSNTTWAGENQTQAGEREILENSPQNGRSPTQSGRVGVSESTNQSINKLINQIINQSIS